MDKETIQRIGESHLRARLKLLENSEPGWVPMFYGTGSYLGDLQEALAVRELLGEPRPQEVTDRHTRLQEAYEEHMRLLNEELQRQSEIDHNRWYKRLYRAVFRKDA